MGRPNGNAALYAISLRKAMEQRGISVRALGKLTDPDDPERGRRRVQRHLTGRYMPTEASQRTYEEALNAPELAPLGEDDEEDSLTWDLTRAIRQAVSEQLRLHPPRERSSK
jgi:hypothetical protein